MNLQKNIMRKETIAIIVLLMINLLLLGCDGVDSVSTSLSIIYGITAVGSLLLLVAYGSLVQKKELWFLLLFSSVFVVNIGYFALSISKNLEEALLANRIAYLGSVFLPMSMFMIIMNVCELGYKKLLPGILLVLSVLVFLIAASPGYLDIYYKEVSFILVDGVGMLDKTYGEWHCVYLFYLVTYFGIMVVTIIYATIKKSVASNLHAIFLAGSVLVNIGVWLLGQLIHTDFEFLSISYIITEFFMLCLSMTRQEQTVTTVVPINIEERNEIAIEDNKDMVSQMDVAVTVLENQMPETGDIEFIDESLTEQQEHFLDSIDKLTPTEKKIYDLYLQSKTTKDIMGVLSITENTLKYHNKNIYSKLGVSSRKQLVGIAKELANLGKI